MSEANSAEPCSTADTPIDPVTREPVMPRDQVPPEAPPAAPPEPEPAQLQILLMQQDQKLKDDEVGYRAILVKSNRRDVAALELFFQSTKPEAQAVCVALSKLRNVVCRTGPVGWNV